MAERIEIEMPPFGKARPRVTRGGTRTYMPTEYQNKRELLQVLYRAAGGEVNPKGIFSIDLLFVFKMPKSWSKKKKEELNGTFCRKVPDVDNLIGAVMDALFVKDQNVVVARGAKYWGKEDLISILVDNR